MLTTNLIDEIISDPQKISSSRSKDIEDVF